MGPKLSSYDFHWIDDDTIDFETLQCLTEADGATMVPVKSTLSLSSLTPTALTSSSIPLNYPRLVSQQGGRWLYFQAFESEHFEFLLNFTTYDGLNNAFNFQTSSEKGSDTWHFDNLLTIDDLLDIDYSFSSKRTKDSEKSSRASRTMEWLFDPLLPQTKAICEKLLRLPGIDGTIADDHMQSLDEQCLEFFNPLNLRRLLDTYWKRWHRNCPIIHPPSFNPSQAPTELVIAMALIGACVSTDPQDAKNARKWLDPAERLIFALPWLSRENDNNQIDLSLTRDVKLRFLQTAILICVLQTWEGSDKAKARVRKLRYPYVAQASQELVYSRPGERIGADLAATLQHWNEFILEEQIIRYEAILFLMPVFPVAFSTTNLMLE
ncbi:zinc finger, c2h2 type domain containing [Trichoderma arundinaceum]|uniref:Zinc finger, c2h2 type domain containing n=1 Tax=Trichoderma arundinaceum TaxID=490622 RepID=A0A395P0X8_TRIAR|nr:zinc finger, c2h2 type domain containing [Trichoderma arundinaceum]